MWQELKSHDRAVTAVLAAGIASVAVWPLAVLLGFHEAPANAPDGYDTYFELGNWWPYPFFFLALAA